MPYASLAANGLTAVSPEAARTSNALLAHWRPLRRPSYRRTAADAMRRAVCNGSPLQSERRRTGSSSAVYFSAAIFFAAQRFLSAATIAALPAGESFRFLAGAGCAVLDGFCIVGLTAAHLFRWASAMCFRAAADILRLPGLGTEARAGSADGAEPPPNI
jgi:hypothetical protein